MFLIQTINGKIRHDFSFTLREAIIYQAELNRNIGYMASSLEKIHNIDPSDIIPVGSVQFVCEFLYHHYTLCPKPKNVPSELFMYANRVIRNGDRDSIKEGRKQFVKSNDAIKGFCDIVRSKDDVPPGNYQISDPIKIDSEYRVFVFRNEIVGIHYYAGDCFVFPDTSLIRKMVGAYDKSPIAYTLDVGVSREGTFVIEVHDFFSCGLYGFANYNILPQMFSSWYYEFLRKNRIFRKINTSQGET